MYVLMEPESPQGWRKPPPDDAVRVWQRQPGVPDDSDANWTVWMQNGDLPSWLKSQGYEFEHWLPEGEEPDWSRP